MLPGLRRASFLLLFSLGIGVSTFALLSPFSLSSRFSSRLSSHFPTPSFPPIMSRGMATIDLSPLKENAILLREEQMKRYHTICKAMGNAEIVMIGEATHGTEEFYRHRADISRILIEEYGFNGVAVEADWPDAYRINRYVCGHSDTKDTNAIESVADFQRFPRWMWRNHATVDFIEWLRTKNLRQEKEHPCGKSKARHIGFYGLDLYALYTAIDQVINFLDKVNPDAAEKARERYSTLEMFRSEEQEYGVAVKMGLIESQEKQVTEMLVDLLRNGAKWIKEKGGFVDDDDELFYVQQNAQLVKDAEYYYRAMLLGGVSTWNIRDTHMFQTMKVLMEYHSTKLGRPAKLILWAHNSHLGDGSASELRRHREINLGQLVRQKIGKDRSFNVGFSTFNGTVSAARGWGRKRETMTVNDALPESYEMMFHRVSKALPETHPKTTETKTETSTSMDTSHEKPIDWTDTKTSDTQRELDEKHFAPIATDHDFMIMLRSNNESVKPNSQVIELLNPPRIQRAIGVCYVKKTERQSHYIQQQLPNQFDCMIHIDESHALAPLDE